ncbi:MAG TPA: elongation factor G [Anaerolineae bacterium]|nr:elongation factor G [Anaerolineae bacterium]
MKEYMTQQVRNIALIGHSGSGKTTFTETLLFLSKATTRRGTVEDGNTVTDFDDEEIRRKISINTAMAPIEWNGIKINLLDTPGYTDFIGEVIGALHVTDLALTLVDAAAGVEVGTELTWTRAEEGNMPTAVVINKMDRENASFEKALASLRQAFEARFVPVLLPIGAQATFQGVVNLLERKAYLGPKGEPGPIPAELQAQVDAYYTELVEAAAEGDDALLEKYFEEEALSPEEIVRGLRAAIVKRSIVPVLGISSTTMIGASQMLDLLASLAPAPDDRGPLTAQGPLDEETLIVSDASPLAVMVFKTTADPFVGKLTYFRVMSGSVESGMTLYNMRAQSEERFTQLFAMRGKEQLNLERLHAGDLGAVAKLSVTLTGDTLCAKDHKLTLQGPVFPQPLYSVAVYPKTKGDTAKMGSTLTRVCEEDPTLHWHPEPTTHEMILSGMGDAHIDTVIRRMQARFGVNLDFRTPKVPYKETITTSASAQYRHKKQTGGAGQFAEVHMRVEPTERDAGFDYAWEVVGGRISSSFMPSIEKGVRSVLEQGVIAGYPIVDVRAAVYDGKEHPVDSKDIAFQVAGREGFKQAFLQARPVLLEPMYIFTITVPEEFTGDVMSDLNTRRARVQGIGQKGRKSIITAQAPLAEMQQYAINLRAITQGRGTFAMEYSHYDVVPTQMAQEIIEKSRREREAEQ